MFSYIQTRHKSVAGYYVVGMFSKYLSVSSTSPLKTGKIVLELTMLRHPQPNFGIKENFLFCV